MKLRGWIWLSLTAVTVWAVSGLPLWVGWLTTPENQVFMARVPTTGGDTPAYYSNIEQARQGAILLANQFTGEPQQPTLFHPVWLVAGWIAKVFALDPPAAYQVVRLLAILLFLRLLLRIVSEFFPDRRQLIAAMAIVMISGGLGWLTTENFRDQVNLSTTPVDLWVAESTTWQSLAHSALFIGSQTLLLFVFWQFSRWLGLVPGARPRGIGPSLALLGLIHPYDLVTAAVVMLGWWAWMSLQGRPLPFVQVAKAAGRWAVWILPVVIYYLAAVFREPAMSGWWSQNLTWTSAPYLIILAYGLLAPLAAFGAFSPTARRRPFLGFCVAWVLLNVLLLYAPELTFQRRLMNGLHLPISLLAAVGALKLWSLMPARKILRWAIGLGFFLVIGLSPARALMLDVYRMVPGNAPAHYHARITRAEYDALQWLRSNIGKSGVIWSEVYLGSVTPGITGRTVVMGHAHQTLNIQARLRDWERFRRISISPSERTELLANLRVRYLVWRAVDQLPAGYNPATDSRWRERFRAEDVWVFELR